MLTGREYGYLYEDRFDEISRYSDPSESEHDRFDADELMKENRLTKELIAKDILGCFFGIFGRKENNPLFSKEENWIMREDVCIKRKK